MRAVCSHLKGIAQECFGKSVPAVIGGLGRGDARTTLIAIALALITLSVFSPVLRFDFVNYDDPSYVYNNPHVYTGLSLANIRWAFSTLHGDTSYWHPLTWISHQLDCQLFGLNARAHHATSLLLHCANSVLLFLVLFRMTAALARSGVVAALFALHPLHVESVAWIAERKDVLCALFWMLCLLAYARYAERRKMGRYLAVLLFFTCALMSKPMAVTLPCVLLLLDFWPLRRIQYNQNDSAPHLLQSLLAWRGLVFEKVPFFILSAVASTVTLWAQIEVGAATPLDRLPLYQRVANAAVAYVTYLEKVFVPTNLSALYLHSGGWPLPQVVASIVVILAISVMATAARHRFPFAFVGWFWYLGTLLPAIGLIQVGPQASADRYTYLPLIGIFVLLTWSLTGLCECLTRDAFCANHENVRAQPNTGFGRSRGSSVGQGIYWIAGVFGMCFLIVFAVVTLFQIHHWRNSETLFRHVLAVQPNNWIAHNNLGRTLEEQGRINEAAGHYEAALGSRPYALQPNVNLGHIFLRRGDTNGALRHLAKPLGRHQPELEIAHAALGYAFVKLGRIPEAINQYSNALALRRNLVMANINLASILAATPERQFRDGPQAVALAERACQLTAYSNPYFLQVLASAYREAGRSEEATKMHARAQALRPSSIVEQPVAVPRIEPQRLDVGSEDAGSNQQVQ